MSGSIEFIPESNINFFRDKNITLMDENTRNLFPTCIADVQCFESFNKIVRGKYIYDSMDFFLKDFDWVKMFYYLHCIRDAQVVLWFIPTDYVSLLFKHCNFIASEFICELLFIKDGRNVFSVDFTADEIIELQHDNNIPFSYHFCLGSLDSLKNFIKANVKSDELEYAPILQNSVINWDKSFEELEGHNIQLLDIINRSKMKDIGQFTLIRRNSSSNSISIILDDAKEVQKLDELANEILQIEHTPNRLYEEQRIHGKKIFDLISAKNDIKQFKKFHLVIFTLKYVSLREQTRLRVADFWSGFEAKMPFKPFSDVDLDIFTSTITLNEREEFMKKVKDNPSTFFYVIVDECHWGVTKDGPYNKFVNNEALINSPNVFMLMVSATPFNNLTRQTKIQPENIIIWDIGRDSHYKSLNNYIREGKIQNDSEFTDMVNLASKEFPSTLRDRYNSLHNSNNSALDNDVPPSLAIHILLADYTLSMIFWKFKESQLTLSFIELLKDYTTKNRMNANRGPRDLTSVQKNGKPVLLLLFRFGYALWKFHNKPQYWSNNEGSFDTMKFIGDFETLNNSNMINNNNNNNNSNFVQMVNQWLSQKLENNSRVLSCCDLIIDSLLHKKERISLDSMKIIRVLNSKDAKNFVSSLKSVQNYCGFSNKFAIVADFGNSFSYPEQFRSYLNIESSKRKGKANLSDFVYEDLKFNCILVLIEKGRTGDTFPESFDCLDMRMRYMESEPVMSTIIQELGRLCRYISNNAEQESIPCAFVSNSLYKTLFENHNPPRITIEELLLRPSIKIDRYMEIISPVVALATSSASSMPTAMEMKDLLITLRNRFRSHEKACDFSNPVGQFLSRRYLFAAHPQIGKTDAYLYSFHLLASTLISDVDVNNINQPPLNIIIPPDLILSESYWPWKFPYWADMKFKANKGIDYSLGIGKYSGRLLFDRLRCVVDNLFEFFHGEIFYVANEENIESILDNLLKNEHPFDADLPQQARDKHNELKSKLIKDGFKFKISKRSNITLEISHFNKFCEILDWDRRIDFYKQSQTINITSNELLSSPSKHKMIEKLENIGCKIELGNKYIVINLPDDLEMGGMGNQQQQQHSHLNSFSSSAIAAAWPSSLVNRLPTIINQKHEENKKFFKTLSQFRHIDRNTTSNNNNQNDNNQNAEIEVEVSDPSKRISNFKVTLSVPSCNNSKRYFDDKRNKAVPSNNLTNVTLKYWIFTPTLIARKDYVTVFLDGVVGNSPHVLVVRPPEYDLFLTDFKDTHFILKLPEKIVYDQVEVGFQKYGVGFARRIIQLFANEIELDWIHMLDDNIRAVFELNETPHKNTVDIRGWNQVKMVHVLSELEKMTISSPDYISPDIKQFDNGSAIHQSHNLMKQWNRDANIDKNNCATAISYFDSAKNIPPEHLYQYTGDPNNYGVIGMFRNVVRMPSCQKQPFRVTHSVNAALMVNIKMTVKKNVFYPMKMVMEDIDFSHLCLQNDLLVVKFTRFIFEKNDFTPRLSSSSSSQQSNIQSGSTNIQAANLFEWIPMNGFELCRGSSSSIKILSKNELRSIISSGRYEPFVNCESYYFPCGISITNHDNDLDLMRRNLILNNANELQLQTSFNSNRIIIEIVVTSDLVVDRVFQPIGYMLSRWNFSRATQIPEYVILMVEAIRQLFGHDYQLTKKLIEDYLCDHFDYQTGNIIKVKRIFTSHNIEGKNVDDNDMDINMNNGDSDDNNVISLSNNEGGEDNNICYLFIVLQLELASKNN